MNDGNGTAPLYPVTSDDHAGWVVTTSVIFLIYSILCVFAKILLRVRLKALATSLPDLTLFVTVVLLFVQTICVVEACNAGLGRHSSSLDESSYHRFSQYYYAASLLYLIIVALTKLSICLLINAIVSMGRLRYANYTLAASIIAWSISGIFALGYECYLPHPWLIQPGKCLDRNTIYIYNGVLNVLTDIGICTLPILMMWQVQTSMTKKMTVCALFGSRIIVPFVVVPWLCTLQPYFRHDTTDATWYAVVPTSLSQISLNLSVMTACIPGLKGVLDTYLGGTSAARIGGMAYILQSKSGSKGPTAVSSNAKSSLCGSNIVSRFAQKVRPDGTFHSSTITAGKGDKDSTTQNDEHSESTTNLTDGVIVRTDAYHVAYEEHTPTEQYSFHFGNISGSDDYGEIGRAR